MSYFWMRFPGIDVMYVEFENMICLLLKTGFSIHCPNILVMSCRYVGSWLNSYILAVIFPFPVWYFPTFPYDHSSSGLDSMFIMLLSYTHVVFLLLMVTYWLIFGWHVYGMLNPNIGVLFSICCDVYDISVSISYNVIIKVFVYCST